MLTMEPQLEPATLIRFKECMNLMHSLNSIVHYVSNKTFWIVSFNSVYTKRLIVLTNENITSVKVLTHNA